MISGLPQNGMRRSSQNILRQPFLIFIGALSRFRKRCVFFEMLSAKDT